MTVDLTLFSDPACPFAFSAEPIRQRLRWHYGDALRWSVRMIVLTLEPGEAEKLADGAPGLQARYGMPIDPSPYSRPASSEPACRAFVAARLNVPERAEHLLRALRVRVMQGGLLDDPELIAAAARDSGIAPGELNEWSASEAVAAALAADVDAARDPAPAARALDHKLGGPAERRRYTAPSYELTRTDGAASAAVPGFNPWEAYEVALAAIAPELSPRARPKSVTEVLEWASEPLATAELVALLGRSEARVRAELAVAATPTAAGADFYWTLR